MKDIQYWIDTSFLKEPPPSKRNIQLWGGVQKLLFTSKGESIRCFNFELFQILTNEKLPLLGSSETINALPFKNNYWEGYEDGVKYFKDEIAVSNDTFYKNSEAYVVNTTQTDPLPPF